jgi:NTE family protein
VSRVPIGDVRNLVFQGGSVKGIAYVGALAALEEAGLDRSRIQRVAGTSAGAITALLLSLGYTTEEMHHLLSTTNFEDFLDEGKLATRGKLLQSAANLHEQPVMLAKLPVATVSPKIFSRLTSSFGIYDGQYFLEWIQDRVTEKVQDANLTFLELHNLRQKNPALKDLYVIGVNANTNLSEIFSWEHTPNVVVADAVRISMSIPFIFKPHFIYSKDARGEVVPDRVSNICWFQYGKTAITKEMVEKSTNDHRR